MSGWEFLGKAVVAVLGIAIVYFILTVFVFNFHTGFPSAVAATNIFGEYMSASAPANVSSFTLGKLQLTGAQQGQFENYESKIGSPNNITINATEVIFNNASAATDAYNPGMLDYVTSLLSNTITINDISSFSDASASVNYTIITIPNSANALNKSSNYLVLGQTRNMAFYFGISGSTRENAVKFLYSLLDST